MPNARLAEDIGQTAPHRSDRNAEPVGVGHRCRQNAGLDPYSVFEQRLRGAIDKQRPCAGIDKNESLIEAIEAGERAAARKVKVMDAPLKGGGMDEMPRQYLRCKATPARDRSSRQNRRTCSGSTRGAYI